MSGNSSLKPCGTRAAYARHLRHGEPACEDCLAANRARTAEVRRAEKHYARGLLASTAANRARSSITEAHRDEYLHARRLVGAWRALRILRHNYPAEWADFLHAHRVTLGLEDAEVSR